MAHYKIRIFLATFSSILNKLCDIVPEILIGIAIDVIVNQQHSVIARIAGISNPFNQLYLVAGLTAILWILESIFEYFYLILWRGIAQEVQHSLRISTYNHMQNLDTAYFEDKKTGGLLAIINDDINQLELFLSEGPNAIIQLIINVIVMGAIFTCFSPTIALLTLLPIPFVLLMAFYFQNRLAYLYEIVRERVEKS
jgi:ATP-binding cassette subfamily B protein